jgi:hypothetical protein
MHKNKEFLDQVNVICSRRNLHHGVTVHYDYFKKMVFDNKFPKGICYSIPYKSILCYRISKRFTLGYILLLSFLIIRIRGFAVGVIKI